MSMSEMGLRSKDGPGHRLSLESNAIGAGVNHHHLHGTFAQVHDGSSTQATNLSTNKEKRGRYAISSVITDSTSAAPLVSGFSLATNPYMPSSFSSLGTTFTDSGLPIASTSGKSVAQRRSRAPPAIVSEVRNVARSDFDNYFKEIGSEYDRWEKERRLGRKGTVDLSATDLGAQRLGLGIDGVAAAGSRTAAEQEQGNNQKGKVKEEDLPPLSDVPRIFFDTSFNLSNPRTFDLVTEKIRLRPSRSSAVEAMEITSPRSDGPANSPIPGLGPLTLADLATDQILQEKLSHYTAVVETHLVREVGLRSSAFFAALTNLQSLHQQGEDCLVKINELQAMLSPKETGIGGLARRGLLILRAQARRRGLESIEEGVRAVEDLWNGLEGVRELVENAEWVGALEVAEDVESMYYGNIVQNSYTEVGDSGTSSKTNGLSIDSIEEEPEDVKAAESSSQLRLPQIRINFTRIKALQGLPKKLILFRTQIAKSLENELVGILDQEMQVAVLEYHKFIEKDEWKLDGRAIGKSVENLSQSSDRKILAGEIKSRERAEERIRPTVRGLVRSDGLESALSAWRELALRTIRTKIREHLPISENQAAEDEDSFASIDPRGQVSSTGSLANRSSILANTLRAMTHAEFLNLSNATYSTMVGYLEVINSHSKLLISLSTDLRKEERLRKRLRKVTQSPSKEANLPIATPSLLTVPRIDDSRSQLLALSAPIDADSPTDDASFSSFITDAVHAAADLANLRFSKVVAVRTEVHSALSLEEFLEVFDSTWAFVVACEQICRRMIVGLRGVMVGQAKSFLQTYHQKTIIQSGELVINEKWIAADVSQSSQAVINLIIQSSVADPPEFLFGKRKGNLATLPAQNSGKATSKPKLDIEGHDYFAVSAGMACAESLAEYIKVILNMPLLTTDTMSKIVEYMKSFNSRTCQVVLGAGAMRSAGLKNITAKHLALASQALSIMIALIPYIRETVRRHLNPKQAVMLTEFDKLKRDFQEHQNEIHSKLIAIMSDRLQVHRKTLASIDWEKVPANQPEHTPNLYMETLVKEHMTLHKVLSRHLNSPTLKYIMMQVLQTLNTDLGSDFKNLQVGKESSKQRLMDDVKYLRMKLTELSGVNEDFGKELETFVAEKSIPTGPGPSSPLEASVTPRNSISSERPSPVLPIESILPTPHHVEIVHTPISSISQEEPGQVPPEGPLMEADTPPTSQLPTSQLATPETTLQAPARSDGPAPYVPRKSMAQRLAELARRRGSHDSSTMSTPTTVSDPIVSTSVTIKSANLSTNGSQDEKSMTSRSGEAVLPASDHKHPSPPLVPNDHEKNGTTQKEPTLQPYENVDSKAEEASNLKVSPPMKAGLDEIARSADVEGSKSANEKRQSAREKAPIETRSDDSSQHPSPATTFSDDAKTEEERIPIQNQTRTAQGTVPSPPLLPEVLDLQMPATEVEEPVITTSDLQIATTEKSQPSKLVTSVPTMNGKVNDDTLNDEVAATSPLLPVDNGSLDTPLAITESAYSIDTEMTSDDAAEESNFI